MEKLFATLASQEEFFYTSSLFVLIICGAAIAYFSYRGSDIAPMGRGVYASLLFASVGVFNLLVLLAIFVLHRAASGLMSYWQYGLLFLASPLIAGAAFMRLSMARNLDMRGPSSAAKSWYVLVPILNFILLFGAPKERRRNSLAQLAGKTISVVVALSFATLTQALFKSVPIMSDDQKTNVFVVSKSLAEIVNSFRSELVGKTIDGATFRKVGATADGGGIEFEIFVPGAQRRPQGLVKLKAQKGRCDALKFLFPGGYYVRDIIVDATGNPVAERVVSAETCRSAS